MGNSIQQAKQWILIQKYQNYQLLYNNQTGLKAEMRKKLFTNLQNYQREKPAYQQRLIQRQNIIRVYGFFQQQRKHMCSNNIQMTLLSQSVPIQIQNLIIDFSKSKFILLGLLKGFRQIKNLYGYIPQYKNAFKGLNSRGEVRLWLDKDILINEVKAKTNENKLVGETLKQIKSMNRFPQDFSKIIDKLDRPYRLNNAIKIIQKYLNKQKDGDDMNNKKLRYNKTIDMNDYKNRKQKQSTIRQPRQYRQMIQTFIVPQQFRNHFQKYYQL